MQNAVRPRETRGVLPPLNMELVRLVRGRRRRRSKRAGRQEQAEPRVVLLDGIGRIVLMQETGGGEDEVGFAVGSSKSTLALEHTGVKRDHGRVFLGWILNRVWVAKRCVRVDQVVGASLYDHIKISVRGRRGTKRPLTENAIHSRSGAKPPIC